MTVLYEKPEKCKVVFDPHHGDEYEWIYHRRMFFQKHKNSKKWMHVKRIRLTKQRIKVLAELID